MTLLQDGKQERLAAQGAASLSPGTRQEVLAPSAEPARPIVQTPLWRATLVVSSLLLGGMAFWVFGGNRLDRGLWLWLAAVVYYLAALGERPQAGYWARLRAWIGKVDRRWLLAALGVACLALFFRLYRLDAVPVDMTSDHAEKLLDVRDVLDGARPIFFERNTGREGFQFYLTAAIVALTPLPVGFLVLKLGTTLIGLTTIPTTYLLGKELLGRRVGLTAAFLLAASQWHVAISRVGLRFPFTAAFAVPALYFLLRALRANRRNDWLAAGAFLGVGLHTYTAMRIVPLLFVLLVLLWFAFDVAGYVRARRVGRPLGRGHFGALRGSFWVNGILSAGFAVLLFSPLFRYIGENPEGFWYRAASRAQATMSPAETWLTLAHNVKRALLMFNYRGDVVPMNTVPDSPVLDPISGGLLVLGILYVVIRFLLTRDRRLVALLVSFFCLLLPSILSLAYPGENPSVARAGGAVPLVMIIVAAPLALLSNLAASETKRMQQRAGQLLVLGLLAVAVVLNYQWYFQRYDENIRRSIWNSSELGAVLADFVARGGDPDNAFHVAYPHWADTRNIGINAGLVGWENAVTDLAQISEQAETPGRKLYLVFPAHDEAIVTLRRAYPQGELALYPSQREGKQFLTFETPP